MVPGSVIRLLASEEDAGANTKKYLKQLTAMMRGDVQSYLELASDYASCGFYGEAIDVLQRLPEAGADQAKGDPMVHYDLGYYFEKQGNAKKAEEHFRLASRMSPDYCFPFRLESIVVLRRAMERNPADARAPY